MTGISSGFNDPKQSRDTFANDMWDRRILVVFPVDDLFPAEGYTFSQLMSYLETNNDIKSLERLEGVDVFSTSEETDFNGFQTKVHDAKNKGALTIVITPNPMDAIFLGPKDHVILYGDDVKPDDVKKTRNVTHVRNFSEACEVLAWIRYDLETSREVDSEHRPKITNIDWSQYPDAPHAQPALLN